MQATHAQIHTKCACLSPWQCFSHAHHQPCSSSAFIIAFASSHSHHRIRIIALVSSHSHHRIRIIASHHRIRIIALASSHSHHRIGIIAFASSQSHHRSRIIAVASSHPRIRILASSHSHPRIRILAFASSHSHHRIPFGEARSISSPPSCSCHPLARVTLLLVLPSVYSAGRCSFMT